MNEKKKKKPSIHKIIYREYSSYKGQKDLLKKKKMSFKISIYSIDQKNERHHSTVTTMCHFSSSFIEILINN